MDTQDIFNKAYIHLLTQKVRSAIPYGCVYRDELGRKCAVGVFIRDEDYRPELEGCVARSSRTLVVLAKAGVETTENNMLLLSGLQRVHDNLPPNEWESALRELAARWKLEVPGKTMICR